MEIEPLNKQNLYLPKDQFSVWDVIWPFPWNWSKLGAIHSWTKLHHEIIQLGAGHSKRIWKDAFCVAGAVQETCSSEMLGGQGADFLRGVAFWSIRSSGLLRWFCVTGAALRMIWHHFCAAGAALYTDGVEKSQNALVRGRQLCTQLSIFEGSLAELLSFWCCQLRKLKESRGIASFLMLSSNWKILDVSQTCCIFDVVKIKNWGSLTE